ncbi:trypsin-like serine protease [Roseateles noduli]|uniref:trypsin-like serine protease n=1 Tax=Roseateles noduli TaxID=2052484 RepID=UPI003D657FDC
MSGLAFALVGGLTVVPTAHALIINEAKFVELGGNLGAVDQTFPLVAAKLRARSLSAQFLTTGWIDRCTATWLGEQGPHTYLLTAAHCIDSSSGQAKAIRQTFQDWYGHVVAAGPGWAFKPPQSADAAPRWDYAEDIAVLRLPRWATPVDAAGRPLERPTISETDLQARETVHFAGYGLTGVGMTRLDLPREDRRMAGEAVISRPFSEGRGIYTSYDPVNAGTSWAFPFRGDSGSAWWRLQDGYWLLSGMTAGGTTRPVQAMSPQVSRHAAWIAGIFPGAVLQSQRMSVTASAPFVSRNHAHDPSGPAVFFVIPPQAGAAGPAVGRWSGTAGMSWITVDVRESRTGATAQVRLRAVRDAGCRRTPIDDAVPCPGSRDNRLKVAFRAEDNPGLKPGAYVGRFDVEALSWSDRSRQERVTLHVDVRHLLRGQVSTTAAYVSPNLAELAAHGPVYYTVLPQPRAWGPATGLWSGSQLPSRIDVTVRDAVTQRDRQVVLRAQRDPLCSGQMTRMEDAVTCQRRSAGRVMVRFHREDNPQLPAGLHRGRVTLQARGWTDRAFDQLIEIDVDLDTL